MEALTPGQSERRSRGAAVRAESSAQVTPMHRQYLELKARHPGAILFFRLGDFYETFDEDAETCASLLQITLTGREMGRGVESCGERRRAKFPCVNLCIYSAHPV